MHSTIPSRRSRQRETRDKHKRKTQTHAHMHARMHTRSQPLIYIIFCQRSLTRPECLCHVLLNGVARALAYFSCTYTHTCARERRDQRWRWAATRKKQFSTNTCSGCDCVYGQVFIHVTRGPPPEAAAAVAVLVVGKCVCYARLTSIFPSALFLFINLLRTYTTDAHARVYKHTHVCARVF